MTHQASVFAIRRFIGSASDRYATSSLDVLIGDPQSLGRHYSGLSASSADYVISLDEDWSGRGRNDIDAILMKNYLFHKGPSDCPTRFIKFVVENTFDQIFTAPQSMHDIKNARYMNFSYFTDLSFLAQY